MKDRHFDRSSDCKPDFYRILYIEKGTGYLRAGNINYKVKGNEILLINKGQRIYFGKDTHLTGYFLFFDERIMEMPDNLINGSWKSILSIGISHHYLSIDMIPHMDINILFRKFYRENLRNEDSNRLQMLSAYINLLLIKISSEIPFG